jgi:hypothetical protein
MTSRVSNPGVDPLAAIVKPRVADSLEATERAAVASWQDLNLTVFNREDDRVSFLHTQFLAYLTR